MKPQPKDREEDSTEDRSSEPSFMDLLIHGKGTVAEPWPTAEELHADKEVQKR